MTIYVVAMIRIATVLLLALVLAAGCGCSPSPQARYASALNAMCADFQARERTIGTPHGIHELAVKGPAIVEAFRSAILVPVRRLAAPPSLAGDARRLRALARAQYDALAELAAAARAGDGPRLLAAAKLNTTLNARSGVIAKRIGAKRCSGG